MQSQEQQRKVLVTWLYIGVFMVMVQVLLGGITRLTGSGLSITEWKPIIGAMYPSSPDQWNDAFAKYKTIAQYQLLNDDFTLSDFKFIFFWEWLHRNWARFIGIVFFIPFLFFIIKGYIKKEDGNKFIILFLVGALQGLVGWVMVASGINDTNLYVNHFKLAAHFITALIALTFIYWLALDYSKAATLSINNQAIKTWTVSIIVLLILQLFYGAFMAGLKAASAAPTWPTINGDIVPYGMWGKSIFSHPIVVHFIHRNLAYVITALIIIFTIKFKNRIIQTPRFFYMPLVLVIVQVVLGIASVLYAGQALRNNMGIFEWNAQLHQLVAMFLLLSLVRLLFGLRKSSTIQ
jgi:heme a synthase